MTRKKNTEMIPVASNKVSPIWVTVEIVETTEVGRFSMGFDCIKAGETGGQAKNRIARRLNEDLYCYNKSKKRHLELVECMVLDGEPKRVW